MYSAIHGAGGDDGRIAAKILERTGPDHDHAAALAALPSLEEFHGRLAGNGGVGVTHAREQLERHALTRGRAAVLAAMAGGDAARAQAQARLPAMSVDHRAIARLLLQAHGSPQGLRQLVNRLAGHVLTDEAEHKTLLAEVDSVPPCHQELAPRFARIAVLEGRLPHRRRALEQVKAAAAAALAKALGDPDAIAAGLVESRALRGQLAPADDASLRRELAAVESDLATLGGTSVAPGPLATELRARRDGIQARIDAARAEHARALCDGARADVEKVRGGDLDALVDFFTGIVQHRAAFPDQLPEVINAACFEALAKDDPQVWARCLEWAGSKEPREF